MLDPSETRGELATLLELCASSPVTAILGPRQCGKTTLSRQIEASARFDLENPRDLARLESPQLALERLTGLVVIDEIQRRPDLFPLLRYLVDQPNSPRFLILGSAAPELLRQGSESLAGRLAMLRLGGFRLTDLGTSSQERLWLRGGFPRSTLAQSDRESSRWREDYIATFLERDIPNLGIRVPPTTLRRFWSMLSHVHGQILTLSELGRSMGTTNHTVRHYVDILESTFMVRTLQPWYSNTSKRLVKSPKIYLRDSGILHRLQAIDSWSALEGHPLRSASWEGFALEECARSIGARDGELYFWATQAGAELDLFWQHEGKGWGIEFKCADAPRVTRSMRIALDELNLQHLWVVHPGRERWQLEDRITAIPLTDIDAHWSYET
ncbi:MAG: ATP-binding protein [Fibrobacteres bacterium]|nr:ATP-binding protein [Fibrobacterota bacterium]